MAVSVVVAAGIVIVVEAALGFATVAPVQLEKTSPVGGVFASIGTTVPAAYEPVPDPLFTVS